MQSFGLATNEVWVTLCRRMPGTRLTGSLNLGRSAQGVAAIEFFAVKLLACGGIGRDQLHRGKNSKAGSEGGILSIHFSFGRAVPNVARLGHGLTGVVDGLVGGRWLSRL